MEGDPEEGEAAGVVHVIETRGRIARMDGRHVHWVRSWGSRQQPPPPAGGERYSLIFYDTSGRAPRPVLSSGVDVAWLADGGSAQ